jgi:sugar transferase (PEP-CTERM system associated)
MATGLIQTAGNRRLSALILAETGLIAGAAVVAAHASPGGPTPFIQVLPGALAIACVCQLCLYYGDLYNNPQASSHSELLIRILHALGATLLILSLLYVWFPSLTLGAGAMAPAAGLAGAAVIAARITFVWLTRQVGPRERLLLVGRSAAALALAKELNERQELGVQIVGYVDVDASGSPGIDALSFLGTIEDIPPIVRARAVDRVVVSLADARGKLPMDKLLDMKLAGLKFDHFASVYEEHTGKIAVENLRPSWLIFSAGFRNSRRFLAVKRMLDVLCGAVGLLIFGPIILVLAAAVRLTSPGPAFYSQRRVGREGRVFTVHKLRSMCADAERDTGPVWAGSGDGRVTRIGRFMRGTRLDELPQFWNILTGSMSLVGPRPERPEFVQSLTRDIPFYGQRHTIKPGLTGWAQVRYTYGATVEDSIEKLQYDLYYIKHMSVALDLFIMFETVKTVLLRRGQ